jgi:hypothetical protein
MLSTGMVDLRGNFNPPSAPRAAHLEAESTRVVEMPSLRSDIRSASCALVLSAGTCLAILLLHCLRDKSKGAVCQEPAACVTDNVCWGAGPVALAM